MRRPRTHMQVLAAPRRCDTARGGLGRAVIRVMAVAVSLCALVPGPSLAQPGMPQSLAPGNSRRPSISLRLGWNDAMPAERFAPIWVTIDPGTRTLDGTVSITLPQDAVQEARLVAPFAAAPGRPAVVEFAASLPLTVQRITVDVRGPGGRLVASQVWNQTPAGRQQLLPSRLVLYDDVIAAVGTRSLVTSAGTWSPGMLPMPSRQGTSGWGGAPAQATTDIYQHQFIADTPPGDLPTAWIAYDSLRCLVLKASETRSIAPGAARAIKDWIQDGGRLVLVADGPGADWISWLDEAAPPESLSDSGERPLPIELTDVMRVGVPGGLAEVLGDAPRPEEAPAAVVPAPIMPARLITLTPLGESLGWRTHWGVAQDQPHGAAAALLSEGPVGLGFVCVVGFDPADAVLGVDRHTVAHVWRHALAGALEPFTVTGGRRETNSGGYYVQGSGDHPAAREGLTLGLDHLADFRVPSGSIFYIIAGACFALAVLVGPVDAIVLKRLGRRQVSWISALGWIAGASAIAWAVPSMGQGGEGRLGRLSVIDQVHDRLGAPVLSRQTALTGIFSARAGNAALETEDPAAWWRGVSSVTTYFFDQRQPVTGVPIMLAVGEVARAAGAPEGAAGRAAPMRASTLASVPMPMWTFRTLLERGRGDLPLVARVMRDGDGAWDVTIAGMPQGAAISSAQLIVSGATLDLAFAADPRTGQLHSTASRSPPRVEDPWAQGPRAPQREPYYQVSRRPGTLEGAPGAALAIMGPDARGDAVERLVASGRWAGVHLLIENAPVDAASRLTDTSRRTIVARLVVPLDEPIAPFDHERWAPPGAETDDQDALDKERPQDPA